MSTKSSFICWVLNLSAGHNERGQGTAEYALVLVAIAAMAGLLISFFTGGGGGLIESLFGSVFSKVTSFIPGLG